MPRALASCVFSLSLCLVVLSLFWPSRTKFLPLKICVVLGTPKLIISTGRVSGFPVYVYFDAAILCVIFISKKDIDFPVFSSCVNSSVSTFLNVVQVIHCAFLWTQESMQTYVCTFLIYNKE